MLWAKMICLNVFCSKEGYIPSNYVVEALNGLEKFEWVCFMQYLLKTIVVQI